MLPGYHNIGIVFEIVMGKYLRETIIIKEDFVIVFLFSPPVDWEIAQNCFIFVGTILGIMEIIPTFLKQFFVYEF